MDDAAKIGRQAFGQVGSQSSNGQRGNRMNIEAWIVQMEGRKSGRPVLVNTYVSGESERQRSDKA